MERGVVLKIDGLPESVSWREVKDVFDEFGEVVFVDHEYGQSHASVRMRNADGIAAVMKATEALKGRLPVRWAHCYDAEVEEPSAVPATEPAAAEAEAPQTTADPYGGGAEPAPVGSPAEPAPVGSPAEPVTDPYGGGDAEDDKKPDDAEPFVVDTAGAAPAAPAAAATGGSGESSISVVRLMGDEE